MVRVFATIGTASAYLGVDYKKGIGIEAKAVILIGGIEIGFITIEGYAGVLGVNLSLKNGDLKIGATYGYGGSISIDVVEYFEFLGNFYGYIYKLVD